MLKVHITRRAFLATNAALASALTLDVNAQVGWPQRPIKLIDAFNAGGSTDLVARVVASKLSARLGQSVVVENKGGAGGALGTEAVVKSAPDGYTLLSTSTAMPTNAATGRKLPYDLVRDLVPIGQIARTPLLLVVPANSPVKTMRDLVDLARAKPNSINYGSSGMGSMTHIAMELLAFQNNLQLVHIPYRGTPPGVTDLLAGSLQAMLGTVASMSQFLAAGKVRALAVASAQRLPFLSNVPTTSEAGFPEFQVDYWFGLSGPAKMPAEIVTRLNAELNVILGQPDMREVLAQFGAVPNPGSPEDFGRLMSFELARWTKLIKDAKIAIE